MHKRRHLVPLLAGAALLAGSAHAGDEDAIQRMQEQIDQLQSEVEELRRQAGPDWLTERRAEEITALVQDVLADADTRASLQGTAALAGWDKTFYLESADGNFRLNFAGQIQVRFIYNHLTGTGRNDDGDPVRDPDRWGFEVRRAKLVFSGHIINPSWYYRIQGEFVRGAIQGTFFDALPDEDGGFLIGDFILDEAFIKKSWGNWYARVGQFKGPFLWEELVSSKRQLAVERSLVNEQFNQDRSQGIELGWTGDDFSVELMYSDGSRSRSTVALIDDTEYAFMGRVDWKIIGDGWRQFQDFTSWSDDEFAFRIGGAFALDRGEYGPDNTNLVFAGEKELVYQFTVDAQIEGGGWNLFSYFVWRRFDEADLDQWGWVIQGGFFVVPDEWELYARYEYGDFGAFVPDNASEVEPLNVITVGVNRYFARHQLKWTTDLGYGINAVSDEWDFGGSGWRSDAVGHNGQIVVRSQLQLLF